MIIGSVRLLALTNNENILKWLAVYFPALVLKTCAGHEEAAKLAEAGENFHILLTEHRPGAGDQGHALQEHFPGAVRLILVPQEELEGKLEWMLDGGAFALIPQPPQRHDLVQPIQHALQWLNLRADSPTHDGEDKVFQKDTTISEALNQFQDRLVTVAAHDIRSPLSVMVGYANVLLEATPELDPKGREMGQRIISIGQRLLEMVDHILDLSSAERGWMELECSPTDPREVVRLVLENLAGLAEENRIEVEVSYDGVDGLVSMDRHKVMRILQNLVSNALKFTEAGQKISVRVAWAGEKLTFQVVDSGTGLSPKQAALVFEKFTRFSRNTKQGSGLGLSIAKTLTELHGGKIWVESTPGKGATFGFSIQPQPEAKNNG